MYKLLCQNVETYVYWKSGGQERCKFSYKDFDKFSYKDFDKFSYKDFDKFRYKDFDKFSYKDFDKFSYKDCDKFRYKDCDKSEFMVKWPKTLSKLVFFLVYVDKIVPYSV